MCRAGIADAVESSRPLFRIVVVRTAPPTTVPPTVPSLRDYCTASFLWPRRLGDVDRSLAAFSFKHIPRGDAKLIYAERVDQGVYPEVN